jgi:hypothetical protein
MDGTSLERLTRYLGPGSRRAAVALVAGSVAALVAPSERDGLARKKRKKTCKKKRPPSNPCAGKNWCIDRSQTCGSAGGVGVCLVEATGGNVCAEIFFQTDDCAVCDDPSVCTDCVCVLATGGGDRCNLGPNGDEFICARPV